MENYREKLKTGQGIGDAVSLQEQIPNKDMVDADLEVDEAEGAESPQAKVIEMRDPGHPKPNRRRKCEIKKKDPGHPKPNPSGYSFFFAEQHARLEPLHHGNNIEIRKIVEEHRNKFMEPEKAVYQEKALKDKERYQSEMENYRKKLKTGQGIGDALPLQEQIPKKDMVDVDMYVDKTKEAESPQAKVIEKRDPGHPKPNRRRKCEIKKKDPGHPKHNPSGYTFFFAEQHARLEPLHHGNNIENRKIVEEHWNKLMEPEKAVYQEKALKDKERDMVDADLEVDETDGEESPQAIVIEKRDPGHPKPNRCRKCEIKKERPW
ncbi:hypothetical protein K1719_026252 [Acacia pycnantha]|nr:hypothetical protein K1719_026252 [Acacia pycnantha]